MMAVKSVGFPNGRVVCFEELSVLEQMEAAATSVVMIGVHGAGLQWAMFMKEGSYLVEIAWPKKFWKFHYSKMSATFKIRSSQVEASSVHLNWTSYAIEGEKV